MGGSTNQSGLVKTEDVEGTNEYPNTHPRSSRNNTTGKYALVGILRRQEALVAARLATATTTANDLEAQVNKLTDQLWDLVKEGAAEISALKKANESLRKDVENERARYRAYKAKVKSERLRCEAMMAKTRKACKEAARALDIFTAEEDSD